MTKSALQQSSGRSRRKQTTCAFASAAPAAAAAAAAVIIADTTRDQRWSRGTWNWMDGQASAFHFSFILRARACVCVRRFFPVSYEQNVQRIMNKY